MAEPLDAQTVTLGTVTFTINKLLPMEGFRLFEKIRPCLADAMSGPMFTSDGDITGNLAALVSMVSAFPQSVVEEVRQDLFRAVRYKAPPGVPNETVLAGEEDTAFKDLEPIHVYEVLVRCLVRNFTGSWAALRSRIPQVEQVMQPSQPGT